MILQLINRAHPVSWWLLGLVVGIAGLLTPDFLILFLICIFAAGVVVIATGKNGRSANSATPLYFYLILAFVVIATRVIFRIIFNSNAPSDAILFDLPRLQMDFGFGDPVEFLGPIGLVTIQQGLSEGLRLAAIILGIGLASALANPRRLLKSMPAALFEIATSVAIAINMAPQLIKSLQRVRKARQLRGRSKDTGAFAGIVIPVLEDTIQSSLLLAASMDSRGFGSSSKPSAKVLISFISISSVSFMAIGSYLLISQGIQNLYLIAVSTFLAITALVMGSRNSNRTRLTSNRFSKFDLVPFAIAGLMLVAVTADRWN